MSEPRDVQGIVDLASAFYGSAALFAALDCGVFAAVEKSGSLEGIAAETGCDARALRLLADACVAEGLLAKEGGVYSNTAAGRMALVPGGPADLPKAIRYNRDVYPAWGRLADFVKPGRPVERPEVHLGEDAARTKAFAAAMFGRAMGIGKGVVPMLGHVGVSAMTSSPSLFMMRSGQMEQSKGLSSGFKMQPRFGSRKVQGTSSSGSPVL